MFGLLFFIGSKAERDFFDAFGHFPELAVKITLSKRSIIPGVYGTYSEFQCSVIISVSYSI